MEFKTKRREDPVVEIAPLIDVVFLLLLFFMVTTQFVSLPGLKLTLPGIEPGTTVTAADKLEVQVTAAGDIYVDGNPVSEERLSAALLEETRDVDSAVVVLMADQDVSHGKVVGLMDQMRRSGLKRVVLAARWSERKTVRR
ncbi:MAG: biopolymer transporter ExbD [Thermodesulfobacteriota bacterium]